MLRLKGRPELTDEPSQDKLVSGCRSRAHQSRVARLSEAIQDTVPRGESAQIEIPAREVDRVIGISSLLNGDTTDNRLERVGVGHVVSASQLLLGFSMRWLATWGKSRVTQTIEFCPTRVE